MSFYQDAGMSLLGGWGIIYIRNSFYGKRS